MNEKEVLPDLVRGSARHNSINVKWLLEPEVFEGETQPLLDVLAKRNIEHQVCKFGTPYEDYLNCFDDKDCVVFYGSLQFARKIQREAKWIPGAWCNLPQYECTYYYPRFGKHLLNSSYVMLPFGDLPRREKWLFNNLGKEESLFIRPSSGFKTFTGHIVKKDKWQDTLQLIGYSIEPETMVVIAPPVEILGEWRLVVVENNIIAATQYKTNEEGFVRISGAEDNVLAYGDEVLESLGGGYNPDPAWILDLCLTQSGKFKVMEVGSFSCSGLYSCDPEHVISNINKAALAEWLEYND